MITTIKQQVTRQGRKLTLTALFAAMLVINAMPAFAQATETPPIDLDIDLTPVFTNISNYLPVFLGLFGVIGGIGIAITLARFIINSIRSAFEGKSV